MKTLELIDLATLGAPGSVFFEYTTSGLLVPQKLYEFTIEGYTCNAPTSQQMIDLFPLFNGLTTEGFSGANRYKNGGQAGLLADGSANQALSYLTSGPSGDGYVAYGVTTSPSITEFGRIYFARSRFQLAESGDLVGDFEVVGDNRSGSGVFHHRHGFGFERDDSNVQPNGIQFRFSTAGTILTGFARLAEILR